MGGPWQDVPAEEDGDAIPAARKITLGIRAVKLVPDLDWASKPELKPLWENASY